MSTKLKAQSLADMAASKVRIPSIPYLLGGRSNRGTDCINLVGWCVQEMGGLKSDVPSGSNTAWRSSMSWKGTMDEANKQGKLVPGALVYILRAPTEKWPDGDYGHVGIYTGERPEFKVYHVIVHASAVDGVTTCPMQTRWSRVAHLKCIDYTGFSGADNAAHLPAGPVVPLPPSSATDNLQAQVVTTGGVLNVRKQPEIIVDNRVGKLQNGDIVDVLEVRDDWARVKSDEAVGWVQTVFLRFLDAKDGERNPLKCPVCGYTFNG